MHTRPRQERRWCPDLAGTGSLLAVLGGSAAAGVTQWAPWLWVLLAVWVGVGLAAGAGWLVLCASGLRRARRSTTVRAAAGQATAADVHRLIYQHWGPGPGMWWTDTNGQVPFSAARAVRYAVRGTSPCAPPVYRPATVARWVLEQRPAGLLVQALHAGISDEELTGYLDGEQPVAGQVGLLLALGAGETTTPVAA